MKKGLILLLAAVFGFLGGVAYSIRSVEVSPTHPIPKSGEWEINLNLLGQNFIHVIEIEEEE